MTGKHIKEEKTGRYAGMLSIVRQLRLPHSATSADWCAGPQGSITFSGIARRTQARAGLGVSDPAFLTAQVIAHVLSFDEDTCLSFPPISNVTGLPAQAVHQAMDELLEAGIIRRCKYPHKTNSKALYRLVTTATSK
ncbi:hypothetical protein [Paraburkholderia adhaesiva]|uniref:hypothetical protein n=1 Tax=Paraburkholderia adhaesiva TaxID=2883244 RepID=UPI001F418D57|nr:hypothetical protein [Paraburkholderia adhaesiva]